MLEGVRRHYIGGAWLEASDGQVFPTLDPASGELIAEVARGGAADIERAVAAAREAFRAWYGQSGLERGRLLFRMAERIRTESAQLAQLETLDNGKPLRQSQTDVEVAARYFEFYAGLADKIDSRVVPTSPDFLAYTLREPLGVCAEIVPWNYPLQISSRAIAAPLAAGNTVVLKPAEETPLTALELARIAAEVGIPAGVFNVVCGYGEEAGASLAAHPGIDHLSFTGSVEVGSAVMQAAARNIVPVTLELGGKSPNVIFRTADLDRAIPIVANSIVQNAGQTCSAGSRLLTEQSVHEEVVERLVRRFAEMRVGPGITNPDLGPLISERQRARVSAYLQLARSEGSQVLVSGVAPFDGGFYSLATVIDGVSATSRVFQEEIFGPVVAVASFRDEDEAEELANSTDYGLVAAVWTKDVAQAHRMARRIRAGQVFVNSYGAGGGVEMPFGGYGKSGFGRVKGLEGLLNYTQIKNVSVYLGD